MDALHNFAGVGQHRGSVVLSDGHDNPDSRKRECSDIDRRIDKLVDPCSVHSADKCAGAGELKWLVVFVARE